MIKRLQVRTDPPISFSEVVRRGMRWAVPKMLSGEIPIANAVKVPRQRAAAASLPAVTAPHPKPPADSQAAGS